MIQIWRLCVWDGCVSSERNVVVVAAVGATRGTEESWLQILPPVMRVIGNLKKIGGMLSGKSGWNLNGSRSRRFDTAFRRLTPHSRPRRRRPHAAREAGTSPRPFSVRRVLCRTTRIAAIGGPAHAFNVFPYLKRGPPQIQISGIGKAAPRTARSHLQA
jgi:hypothetical protein